MFLPGDDESWEALSGVSTASFVALLNRQLLTAGDRRVLGPLVYHPERGVEGEPDGNLHIERAWSKALAFYPEGWRLYRFGCAIQSVPALAGYESPAYLFAVCGPEGAVERCVLLDWTSAPLDQLNRQLDLDLSLLGAEAVREYLIFFCSFLAGDADATGSLSPFVLPQDARCFAWDQAIDELEAVAAWDGLRLFEPLADLGGADPPDLSDSPANSPDGLEPAPALTGPRQAEAQPGSKETKREAIERAFASHPATPAAVPFTLPPEEEGTEAGEEAQASPADTSVVAEFKGLVWYRDALFLSLFRLYRRGRVEMVEDEPVMEADALPVPRWEVQRATSGVRLLCRQKPREVLSAALLLERIQSRIRDKEHKSAPRSGASIAANPRLRGLRVRDPLRWSEIFKGSVVLDDVEFVHDVVLDDSVFERSLELVNCRFLRRLSARDATVKGALRLDGSRVEGAVSRQRRESHDKALGEERPRPVVELRGLRVERGLFADRLTCFGRVRAEWCRVMGTLQARGLQIHPRPGLGEGPTALDLSHAQIDGPLDLSGHLAKKREPGGRQRTVLSASAKFSGLHAAQINLSGIRVEGGLDLSSCTVKGEVRLSLVGLEGGVGEQWWRSRIAGALGFDRARTGLVEMSGCEVGGDLRIVEMQISGSIFAELSNRFRTRIGGTFLGSGANVAGGIELEGAQIEGDIEFVTGHFGRLRASAGLWVLPASSGRAAAPRLCLPEANAIVLQDVVVDASLYLIGICLHGRSGKDAGGDLSANGVRLGGGVRFWTPDTASHMRHGAKLAAPDASSEAVDALVRDMRAEIAGGVDLRGLRAEGAIEFGRLRVGREVQLQGARLGGNLQAHVPGESVACEARGFTADAAHIKGHADLRGLVVNKGHLSARDAEITGQLLLATPDKLRPGASSLPSGGHARVLQGGVDLEGAKAARLVLTSKIVASGAACGAGEAAFVLSRCQFGQLRVLGFAGPSQRKRFAPSINLVAITVGDWGVDADTESLPLLEATAFDGRNYVDMEQRLAKIGKKGLADRVYRSMLRRGASGWWARLLNRANYYFSGNGTVPALMFGWLLLCLLPVVVVLANPANVEFTGPPSARDSDARSYDLERDWDWVKAAGLAASYALPFLGGSKSDVVRARLVGPTCVELPAGLPFVKPPDATLAGTGVAPRSSACAQVLAVPVSPHELAMMFSTIQFMLWILVAANLPAIARRRP